MKFIQVMTAIYDKKKAEKIANHLLKKKLTGCVQILGPVESQYWWEGKIVKDKEWLLIIKTSENLYKKVEKEIKAVHDYSVPEILAIPVVEGSKDYLNWLSKLLK